MDNVFKAVLTNQPSRYATESPMFENVYCKDGTKLKGSELKVGMLVYHPKFDYRIVDENHKFRGWRFCLNGGFDISASLDVINPDKEYLVIGDFYRQMLSVRLQSILLEIQIRYFGYVTDVYRHLIIERDELTKLIFNHKNYF